MKINGPFKFQCFLTFLIGNPNFFLITKIGGFLLFFLTVGMKDESFDCFVRGRYWWGGLDFKEWLKKNSFAKKWISIFCFAIKFMQIYFKLRWNLNFWFRLLEFSFLNVKISRTYLEVVWCRMKNSFSKNEIVFGYTASKSYSAFSISKVSGTERNNFSKTNISLRQITGK